MADTEEAFEEDAEEHVIIIKKYANRRLYNTQTSVYITLDDIRAMVKEGAEFVVQDARTGEDLTRHILTQVIFEQELNGPGMLPVGFLKRVIEMYDEQVSDLIPHYLDSTMEAFVSNQEKMQSYMDKTFKQYSNPMSQFGEIQRQNVELFSKTFQMFNPFESFTSPPPKKKKKSTK